MLGSTVINLGVCAWSFITPRRCIDLVGKLKSRNAAKLFCFQFINKGGGERKNVNSATGRWLGIGLGLGLGSSKLPWEQPWHFKVLTSTPSVIMKEGGLIIAAAPSAPAAFDYVYDYYGTAALTRFSNGFMADPVKDFINFNWKLREDAALE